MEQHHSYITPVFSSRRVQSPQQPSNAAYFEPPKKKKASCGKEKTTQKMIEVIRDFITPEDYCKIYQEMQGNFPSLEHKMKHFMHLANRIDPTLAARCVAKLKSKCGMPLCKRKRKFSTPGEKMASIKKKKFCASECAKALLQSNTNGYPLLIAARHGNMELMDQVISKSNNVQDLVSKTDLNGNSALHIAAKCGRVEVVQKLLDWGWDPNLRNEIGKTPLLNCCRKGKAEIMKVLLNVGAEVNVADNNECTPLMEAIRHKHNQIVETLIVQGANVNFQGSKKGITPLMVAAIVGNNKALDLLLENGAKDDKRSAAGFSSFLLAARAGNEACCSRLYNKTIAKDDVCFQGYGAIHIAARNGHTDVVLRLLQLGYPVNITNPQIGNKTALMLACEFGRTDTALKLLAFGAKRCVVDRLGYNARQLAELNGQLKTVQALKLAMTERCSQ